MSRAPCGGTRAASRNLRARAVEICLREALQL